MQFRSDQKLQTKLWEHGDALKAWVQNIKSKYVNSPVLIDEKLLIKIKKKQFKTI